MHHLDVQVIDQALDWARSGRQTWFCTVIATYGSAPRSPGAMFVATAEGQHRGSLSGGCVEDAFLEALARGEYQAHAQLIRYGDTPGERDRLKLPCGGVLQVLVERRPASEAWVAHLDALKAALAGQRRRQRRIDLTTGDFRLLDDTAAQHGVRVQDEVAYVSVGPALRLILAGLSPVAEACGVFAKAIGCEVIACDPRDEYRDSCPAGIRFVPVLPSMFIADGGCHAATAVVALTHDPRIDDLTMIEAVRTQAFYIGAMGSHATSAKRAERLRRIGGFDEYQLARLHMPIGLNLGSKSPPEIGIAVIADVLRVYNHRAIADL